MVLLWGGCAEVEIVYMCRAGQQSWVVSRILRTFGRLQLAGYLVLCHSWNRRIRIRGILGIFWGLVRFGVVLQRMVIDEYARLCGLVVFGTFFALACLRIPHFFVGGDGYEVMCCGFVWHVVVIHGAIV